MASSLGKTLLIANPAAQNGNGMASALYAGKVLREALGGDSFREVMTEGAGHGREVAATAQDYDTVVALGGDGLIHEVANGLMDIPEAKRPAMGVLPVGTGNDYARTLGMDFEIEISVEQLLNARQQLFDVGCCNGEYFVETLSFGLDAAIALDTVDRRKRTGKTGTALFLESGIDVMLHKRDTFDYVMSLDGADEQRGQALIFAVQVGPSYGGGFTICPEASTSDGLLDLCIAHPPMGALKAVFIFLLAKNAHHTKFKQIDFHRTQKMSLSFEGKQPPVQVDGEPLCADTYEIECIPHALQVLVP